MTSILIERMPKQRMTAEVGGVTYKLRPEGSGVSHAIRIEK